MNIVIVNRGIPIPVQKYGGTERVIWGLGYCLSSLGHKVTYIVPEDSKCDFADIIIYDDKINLNSLIPKDTDIVHLQFNTETPLDFPSVITMHGYDYQKPILSENTIFVSEKHAELHNSKSFVHNGLLWEDYQKVDWNVKRQGFHFLGKADWKIKNVENAIDIALSKKEEISILGGKRFSSKSMKRNIFHALNPKVKFQGMVGGKDKYNLLNQSKGLLFPVRWHEPFGLAIIESLYYGCPVIASNNGAIPEIINPEVGFCSNNLEALKAEISNINSYKPLDCHHHAKVNFSAMRMTLRYLETYDKVLSQEDLNPTKPQLKTLEGVNLPIDIRK